MEANHWKKCSTCKKEINFSTDYYQCSVSTCQHKRKGFQFCSVSCWDGHLGFANHREAWAEEAVSPSKAEYLQSVAAEQQPSISSVPRAPVKKVVNPAAASFYGYAAPTKVATDTLVVVSKVKNLIKDQSGFNTSQCCIDALTQKVVKECLAAIENAKRAERKTVMGRDVK